MLKSDKTEIARRENARRLARESGGQAQFADRIDRAAAQINHYIGPKPSKNIGKKIARHIERCYLKPEGWLDEPHFNVEFLDGAIPDDTEPVEPAPSESEIVTGLSYLEPDDAVAIFEAFLAMGDLTESQRFRLIRAALPDQDAQS